MILENRIIVASISLLIFLIAPIVFVIGAWLLHRRFRSRRWILVLYSLSWLLTFALLTRVPTAWQFTSSSANLVGLSYIFGLGWNLTPVLAIFLMIVRLLFLAASTKAAQNSRKRGQL